MKNPQFSLIALEFCVLLTSALSDRRWMHSAISFSVLAPAEELVLEQRESVPLVASNLEKLHRLPPELTAGLVIRGAINNLLLLSSRYASNSASASASLMLALAREAAFMARDLVLTPTTCVTSITVISPPGPVPLHFLMYLPISRLQSFLLLALSLLALSLSLSLKIAFRSRFLNSTLSLLLAFLEERVKKGGGGTVG
jgi:hypothetical protein